MSENSQQPASLQTNQFGDSYVDVVNQSHFQNKSAADIYSQILKTSLNAKNTLYVIIGTDSGLFPKHLNQLPTPEKSQYLFIELDLIQPIAIDQCANEKFTNCHITSPSGWEDMANELNLDHYIYDDSVIIVNSLAANEGHIPDYKDLFDLVKTRLFSVKHELISTTSQTDFLKNSLLNTIDNIQPAIQLTRTASGTAIILGAGPSLNDHLDWIKENQDKLTIIAVSRIYQQLTYAGISPDIVVSSDPYEINYQQSKALLASKSVILVHTNHVSPRLIAQWDGLAFYRDRLFPWDSGKDKDNVKNEGPTVTHSCLALALEMGFDNIYLAGVDLCFKSDGTTHADGQKATIDNQELPTVTTYKGDTAYTDNNLLMGVKYLAEIAVNRSGNIFNLNENAARVENIEYSKKPGLSIPKNQLPEFQVPTQKQRHDHIIMVKNELAKARKTYSEIVKLCKDAIRFNNGLHGKKGLKQDDKNQPKLDKAEKSLNTKYKNHTPLAQLVASRHFLRLLNKNTENRTPEQEYNWLDDYYAAYLNGSSIVLDTIEAALKAIDFRLQEYRPQIKFLPLIDYWQQEKITGRSCLWLESHDEPELPAEIKHALDEQCENFRQDINANIMSKRQLNHAIELAKNNQWPQAIQQVEQAYQRDKTLKDGFARLGWVFTKVHDWRKAWEIAGRDFEHNRLSPSWKLNFSLVLGRLDDFETATSLVSQAYSDAPHIKDAYARLAWITVDSGQKDWEKAWKIAQLDWENQTLTPVWQVHLAQLFARIGDYEKAAQLIDAAYARDINVMDGYARLGCIQKELGNIPAALDYFKIDVQKKRLSDSRKAQLAYLKEKYSP